MSELLDRDKAFKQDARALSGGLYLHDQHRGVTIRFERGRAVATIAGPDPYGTSWQIGGTREAWTAALGGEDDIFHMTDPRLGRLSFEGDAIRFAGNAKAFTGLWEAFKEVSGSDLASTGGDGHE